MRRLERPLLLGCERRLDRSGVLVKFVGLLLQASNVLLSRLNLRVRLNCRLRNEQEEPDRHDGDHSRHGPRKGAVTEGIGCQIKLNGHAHSWSKPNTFKRIPCAAKARKPTPQRT